MLKKTIVKRIQVAIILVLLVSLFGLNNCSLGGAATTSPNKPTSSDEANTGRSTSTAPKPGIELSFSFPDGAPRLNQTAQLKFLIKVNQSIKNISATISLPEGFQLVSGDLSWSGGLYNPPDPNKGMLERSHEMSVIIKAVRVGNWTINAIINLSSESGLVTPPGGLKFPVYVSVSESSSEWQMYHPPWENWQLPSPLVRVDKYSVVKTDLEISHAPKLNEPAKLFITTVSPVDFPGLSLGILISPKSAELSASDSKLTAVPLVPGANQVAMQVTGVDLQANVPYHFSAIVVFKDIGYYHVTADASQKIDNTIYHGIQDTIYLKIGAKESTFEREPPKETTSGTIPPTPPAIHP